MILINNRSVQLADQQADNCFKDDAAAFDSCARGYSHSSWMADCHRSYPPRPDHLVICVGDLCEKEIISEGGGEKWQCGSNTRCIVADCGGGTPFVNVCYINFEAKIWNCRGQCPCWPIRGGTLLVHQLLLLAQFDWYVQASRLVMVNGLSKLDASLLYPSCTCKPATGATPVIFGYINNAQ